MRYADVVLDIPTRALEGSFCYTVPPELEATALVGTTVLVTFSHRAAVGYVVGLADEPPAEAPSDETSPAKIQVITTYRKQEVTHELLR